MNSTELEGSIIHHSNWLQLIYKNAAEIVRSQLNNNEKKNYYPEIKRLSIMLDSRLFDIELNQGKEFDGFIRIKLPYMKPKNGKTKLFAETINLPFKFHKQSHKFKDWKKANSIELFERNGIYYIKFIYEKNIDFKTEGSDLGLDQGINKLISDSNGNHYGIDLTLIYKKLSQKIRGSRSFKKLLIFKNQLVNQVCNELDLTDIKNLFIEDLKPSVKKGYGTQYRNKNQYWVYSSVIKKINLLCEENGIFIHKVDPSYTSQRCSNCGIINKENRKGEVYQCNLCGTKIDADTNGAKNIMSKGKGFWRGEYNPSYIKNNKQMEVCFD